MGPRRLLAALAASALLAVPACSDQEGEPRSAGRPDPGVTHVHGLGVDPADGTLYAATHTGLFRLGDGTGERVAGRYQDTMGFTVVGPRTFLGSGHPDPVTDPGAPSRLGLIRSSDAGRTWQPVSLRGEADFHVLRFAHGAVYGWEAGSRRLMASADEGRTWEERATLPLHDFVVSPDTARVMLAATEQGLLRSVDGGRTFARTDGPSLVTLAWGRELVGLDETGRVHASGDGGGTWSVRGSLGSLPEALLADGEALYAAAAGRGVLASQDGGRTWTARYVPGPTSS